MRISDRGALRRLDMPCSRQLAGDAMTDRSLLMIPGPIEVSPEVHAAYGVPPPGHLSPPVMAAFGASLRAMREIWRGGDEAQPFVIAGSGTLGMDMAASNILERGDKIVVVDTGYFSQRAARIARRIHDEVTLVSAEAGRAPDPDELKAALAGAGDVKAVFLTHVDTSTGVRLPIQPYARVAKEAGALVVVDGVCATAGEVLEMEAWGVDVALTGSQKAIGLPAGLSLTCVSRAALQARRALSNEPPLYLDWEEWLPIMEAYEAGQPRYFATPATNLIMALDVGLKQILDDRLPDGTRGITARVARHGIVAGAMRDAFEAMGMGFLPVEPHWRANTMSAVWLPEGGDATLPKRVAGHGVVIAGGLHPELKEKYFRVGHMGWVTTQPALLERTVRAIGAGLSDQGVNVDADAAVSALHAGLASLSAPSER
jgi:alanine-glyoxylate transaminase/serine-glyoxylate transaminase/serine-pyruvate transaminase